MKRIFCRLALTMALTGIAIPSRAQSSVSDVLDFLVTNQSIATGSVQRDRAAAQATSDTIGRSVLASLATLPVSTSSGGFVYRLDPNLGTMERQSTSFGPLFVERAVGIGAGSASVGVTLQHLRFTALDGHNLRDGSLITTANQFADETAPFDVDRLTLDINADVATIHGSVGITDDTEIGAALPLVSLRVDGARINTYRGQTFTQASASAKTVGMADLLVRVKQLFYQAGGSSLAGVGDIRLPTGRARDLLGAGSTAVRFAAVGSLEARSVGADANVGVTLGGLAREWSYSAAITAATDRVTWTTEILGRWLNTPGSIAATALPHPTLAGVETLRLVPTTSSTHLLTIAPGIKWNASDTWVVVANVLIPLTRGGLTTSFTPLGGVDYGLR